MTLPARHEQALRVLHYDGPAALERFLVQSCPNCRGRGHFKYPTFPTIYHYVHQPLPDEIPTSTVAYQLRDCHGCVEVARAISPKTLGITVLDPIAGLRPHQLPHQACGIKPHRILELVHCQPHEGSENARLDADRLRWAESHGLAELRDRVFPPSMPAQDRMYRSWTLTTKGRLVLDALILRDRHPYRL